MGTTTQQKLVIESFLLFFSPKFTLTVVVVKFLELNSVDHSLRLLGGKHVDQKVLENLLFVLSSVLSMLRLLSFHVLQ